MKLRGQRIELGEIEATLAELPGVAEAAVVVHDLGASGPFLAAYVALRSGTPFDARELRARAANRLTDSMLPAFWTELASLPKSTAGKVDYTALPRPSQATAPLRRPARDGIELAIAGIWAGLLDRTEIERNESFFDLGGHSLLAMRALARMNAALGAALSLADFFNEPTVEALAARIERSRVTEPAAGSAPREEPIEEHLDQGDLAEIRTQLAGLADDEIDDLLRRALGDA